MRRMAGALHGLGVELHDGCMCMGWESSDKCLVCQHGAGLPAQAERTRVSLVI